MTPGPAGGAAPPATTTEDDAALRGSRCPGCGALVFPAREECPGCDEGRPEPVALPTTGTVWTHAVLHVAAPSYEGPVPYALGVVDLGEIRVTTTLLADDLDAIAIGDVARFEPVRLGPHSTFAFRVGAR